jgi:hypothetical protein
MCLQHDRDCRHLTCRHGPALADAADHAGLGAMLGIEPEEENAEWLRSTFPADGQHGEQCTAYWFAITHPESGEPIGEIGVVGISWPNRHAGVSILVLPGSRRAGVVREGVLRDNSFERGRFVDNVVYARLPA